MSTTVLVGDCREVLAGLEPGSVQTCVTSPPYFGLRDYGTASWQGGDADCGHVEMSQGMSSANTLGPNMHLPLTNAANVGRVRQYRETCGKCGARRVDRQIGLEATVEHYVAELVAVFREVRRVLREDGTLWANLGDSFGPGKQLLGVPWRVAFALQADGWYLRSDIIWHKPNPMPESVRDRPTKAHEYLFLLSKQSRYYYDAEAIKEPSANLGATNIRFGGSKYGDSDDSKHATKSGNAYTDNGKRNKRSVWTVSTRPFTGAHFATFPPTLIEPCILAGSRPGNTVLDPFAGAGTTLLVASRHGRNGIGIELNPEYAAMARERIAKDAPLLATVAD